ncbi:MAG: FHA domain-containing protein [Gammaproteobacteria bacterium]|nr:MAG: FHA domain-containing protein [Gammaproteobacteria bacterium]
MAKFSVFFKDNPLHSAIFESGVVHIGRDESNEISIDSLAFAPAHAAVILQDTGNIIKQLNADFPLIINGERHSKHHLKNGDTITIGKHHIVYNPAKPPVPSAYSSSNKSSENPQPASQIDQPEASLQILAGKHIGRLVPLKKNMTRIGHKGAGIIIISRRREGYFASVLESDDNKISINNITLMDDSIQLKNNDSIMVNNIPMQFIWTQKS